MIKRILFRDIYQNIRKKLELTKLLVLVKITHKPHI